MAGNGRKSISGHFSAFTPGAEDAYNVLAHGTHGWGPGVKTLNVLSNPILKIGLAPPLPLCIPVSEFSILVERLHDELFNVRPIIAGLSSGLALGCHRRSSFQRFEPSDRSLQAVHLEPA